MGRHRQLKGPTEARIEHLDTTGAGRGQTDGGESVRVPGTWPGERISFEPQAVSQKGLHHGHLLQVLDASSDRTNSPCARFLSCSGCDLLTLSYSAQLRHKAALVADKLSSLGGEMEEIVPSPQQKGYRAHAKWVLSEGRILGSYQARSHQVIDMSGCIVHAPALEEMADGLRIYLAGNPADPALRYILARCTSSMDQVLVTLVAEREGFSGRKALVNYLRTHASVNQLDLHLNQSAGNALIDGQGKTVELFKKAETISAVGQAGQQLRSEAFTQINPQGAKELYQQVVRYLEPSKKRVLDLYSGSGGIALTLAAAGARQVEAVEKIEAAVLAGRAVAQQASVPVRFHHGPAAEAANLFVGDSFDAVVVNPPRKGLDTGTRAALAQLGFEDLVYVSCNPETLARDLELLSEILEVKKAVAVDMFPQTRHVETVVWAKRKIAD